LCGQIFDQAGPELQEELDHEHPKQIETGKAVITKGYLLHAASTFVLPILKNTFLDIIHAVGPRIKQGEQPTPAEEDQLLNAYKSSLNFAIQRNDIRTIVSLVSNTVYYNKLKAFPSISTGLYFFPKIRAAELVCDFIVEWLSTHGKHVTFYAFFLC
jgi:O-acetyl-ADP-ribose deacetylase (regulator of RNase III)